MARNNFFLDPDDSQTYGNLNYMRKSTRVRHTFPKNLKNPNGFEVVKEISSLGNSSLSDFPQTIEQNNSVASASSQINQASSISSTNSSSNNMDFFRSMARNMKQK